MKISDSTLRKLTPPSGRTSVSVAIADHLSLKATAYLYQGKRKITRSYFIRYNLGGKRYTESIGRADELTVEQARSIASRCLEIVKRYQVRPSEYISSEELHPTTLVTLGKLAEMYLSRPQLQPRTVERYQLTLAHLPERLKQIPLEKLTRAELSGFLLSAEISQSEKSRLASLFSSLLGYAVTLGLLESNPAAALSRAFPLAEAHHHQAVDPEHTSEELAEVLKALYGRTSHCVLRVFLLALFTLLRYAEVKSLRLEDVDRERKIIHCRRTKTLHQGFDVPLTPALEKFIATLADGRTEGPILQSGNRALCCVVLKPLGVTLHGCRSAGAGWMVRHGISPHIAEACLSHRIGGKVTVAYLRGDFLDERRKAMTLWHAELMRLIQENCDIFHDLKNNT